MIDAPASPDEKSSDYLVLARKYRPQSFDELIGQQALVQTLSNAIKVDRVHHAFILTGVRGVGKTTTARIIARALNCSNADGPTITPCGECENCVAIAESRHLDVQEMDAASRTGIGDIRELIEGVQYAPVSARYKVYIIDEVHMLSTAAFNGLLKTLEEPPEHVKFIFATTEIRKIPVTVLSRCQRFDLRRVSLEELVAHFANILAQEGIEAEPEVLAMIANAAEGSVRDGLSLLDQAIAHSGGKVETQQVRDMLGLADRSRIYDLFEHLLSGDIAGALKEVREQYDLGVDPIVLLQDLLEVSHWLTRLKIVPDLLSSPAVSEVERSRGGEMAEKLSMPVLARCWQMLLKGLAEARNAPSSLAAVEMVLIRLAYSANLPTPGVTIRDLARSDSNETEPKVQQPNRSGNHPPNAMVGANSAGAEPVLKAEAAIETAPEAMSVAEPMSDQQFVNLADIAAKAETERDAMLYYNLRENVHEVAFEQGRIEIRPNEDAPRDLAQELSGKLKEWTSQRWIVTINSEAEGAPTLAEQSRLRKIAERREAADHPLVQAVMDAFPGAEITDVRKFGEDNKFDDQDGE